MATKCCTCDRPLLRIKLDPFAPDERLAFVESNLNLLNESRFRRDQTLWPIVKPTSCRPQAISAQPFRFPAPLPAFGVSGALLPMHPGRLRSRRLGFYGLHLGNTSGTPESNRDAGGFIAARLMPKGSIANTRAGPPPTVTDVLFLNTVGVACL